jgi:hypothetical protein
MVCCLSVVFWRRFAKTNGLLRGAYQAGAEQAMFESAENQSDM